MTKPEQLYARGRVSLSRARHAEARRFLEEARITGQLQHPGVPPVHQIGRLSDGRPFLAMKLIKGQTLAEMYEAGRGRQDADGPGPGGEQSGPAGHLAARAAHPPAVPPLLEDMEFDRSAPGPHRRGHGEAVPDIGDRIVRRMGEEDGRRRSRDMLLDRIIGREVRQAGGQHRIGDGIANFVRVAFTDGFGREDVTTGHEDSRVRVWLVGVSEIDLIASVSASDILTNHDA